MEDGKKYPGLEDQIKRFAHDLKDERVLLLFKIAYKLGFEKGRHNH